MSPSVLAWRAGRGLLLTVLAISVVFFAVHTIGDPAAASLGPRATPEQLAAFRSAHGLDQPLVTQWLAHLGALARLDLGTSLRTHESVVGLFASRLPRTLGLVALSLAFEVSLGVLLGVLAATRRGRPLDLLVLLGSSLLVAVPTFLTGLLALQLLAFRWHAFPLGGLGTGGLDTLWHVLLPALVLASAGLPTYARIVRSEVADALDRPHVVAARARGLSDARAIWKHAVRHAAIPVVALIGQSAPLLITGAVITESVFQWPGMGRLAIESITTLDLPVLLGIVTLSSVAVQLGNLAADLAQAELDPRSR